MERLNSWLSSTVIHALGWALIHSLWQGVAVVALAALLMTVCRRPSIRYLVGVGALTLMLAALAATFLLLMSPAVRPALPTDNSIATLPVTNIRALFTAHNAAPTYSVIGLSNAVERSTFATIANSSRPMPSIFPWLVGAWLCGVVFFSLRFAGGFLLLLHNSRRQSRPLSAALLVMCQGLEQKLGLRRHIRYLECSWLQVPAVIGWLRPVIFLPVGVLTGLSETQLRAVIAHELAHIRRLDAFVNLFQVLAHTLLFYHPAIWWLNRRINGEREIACDEIAVAVSGDRVEYVKALAIVAERAVTPTFAMAINRGSLVGRILYIMGQRPSGPQRALGLTGSLLFLAAALGAANGLFGIAYPIPAAHAQASVKAMLVSSRAAVAEIVQQATRTDMRTITDVPSAPAPNTASDQPEKLVVPPPDLSHLPPDEPLATPTLVASNTSPPPASETLPGAAIPIPSAARQIPANNPSYVSAQSDSNEPHVKAVCYSIDANSHDIVGRVISSKAIELQSHRFFCHRDPSSSTAPDIFYGVSCKNIGTPVSNAGDCTNRPSLAMNVIFADPADAGKMQPGELVTLAGDFRVITQDKFDYLFVQNAHVLNKNPPPEASSQFTQAERDAHFPAVSNPQAVSCRMPSAMPGSRLGQVCKTNAEWAQYPKYGNSNWADPGVIGDSPGTSSNLVSRQ